MEVRIMTEKELNVLLVCGTGASSGFMAANMRKAAKKAGLTIKIQARSESQLEDMIDDVDYLLVGPHLSYKEEELRATADAHQVKMGIIPQTIYGTLNGKAALEFMQAL
jgi:PTS system cellobiose-specific IIB component